MSQDNQWLSESVDWAGQVGLTGFNVVSDYGWCLYSAVISSFPLRSFPLLSSPLLSSSPSFPLALSTTHTSCSIKSLNQGSPPSHPPFFVHFSLYFQYFISLNVVLIYYCWDVLPEVYVLCISLLKTYEHVVIGGVWAFEF